VALFGSVSIFFCYVKLHQKSAYQFRSLSNLLDAMVQGDYSLRARSSHNNLALNELVLTINTLSERLNKQRMQSIESQLLLNTVIEHIDVAIVAFNDKNEVALVNPTAKKLLQLSADINQTLPSDQLAQLKPVSEFTSGQSEVVSLTLGNQQGKFKVHMEEFRASGKPHKLLFITDVRLLLRSEERNAWQSLVRVISHEINNSLAPIASIGLTLKRSLSRTEQANIEPESLIEGLNVITQRANNLTEFVNSYKKIARLPAPQKQKTSIIALLDKVTPLFQKHKIIIESQQDHLLDIDPVQIEQVLINLLKNAIEANQEAKSESGIAINWQVTHNAFSLTIADNGIGISNLDNLFVPFYTTKKQGSGIGLVLCRQILEVHNGQLTLTNKPDNSGCLAIIELPL
jgi:nitrogen fixation/metabolism regulation signal transduction histidine kinase